MSFQAARQAHARVTNLRSSIVVCLLHSSCCCSLSRVPLRCDGIVCASVSVRVRASATAQRRHLPLPPSASSCPPCACACACVRVSFGFCFLISARSGAVAKRIGSSSGKRRAIHKDEGSWSILAMAHGRMSVPAHAARHRKSVECGKFCVWMCALARGRVG